MEWNKESILLVKKSWKIKGEKAMNGYEVKVQQIKVALGCNQTELAKRLGVGQAAISHWLTGKTQITKKHKRAINKLWKEVVPEERKGLEQVVDFGCAIERLKEFSPIIQHETQNVEITDIDTEIERLEKRIANLKQARQEQKWQFTEDEKVILRNLPEDFKFIARDENGGLIVTGEKVVKNEQGFSGVWSFDPTIQVSFPKTMTASFASFDLYKHLFKCISWNDEIPCEFRKFV